MSDEKKANYDFGDLFNSSAKTADDRCNCSCSPFKSVINKFFSFFCPRETNNVDPNHTDLTGDSSKNTSKRLVDVPATVTLTGKRG